MHGTAYPARPRPGMRSGLATLEPNLMPLLDVVLQLIVFLLMLVAFGTRVSSTQPPDIRLPTVPAALPAGSLGSDLIEVALDREGGLIVADHDSPLTHEEADAWWADQARQRQNGAAAEPRPLGTEVIVRADEHSRHGQVRRALETAQRHGFRWFSLVVRRGTR